MNNLYQKALRSPSVAKGFYNDNVRVETVAGPVMVRIPIPGADSMDLKIWPEQEVLAALTPWVSHVPRLLHVSRDPAFQVHEFIPGDVIDDIAPRGKRVPPAVLRDVVTLFIQLTQVPQQVLPGLPLGWPQNLDSTAFARLLSDITQRVHSTFRERYRSLFHALGIPDDPLEAILPRWRGLTPRPFGLVHSDLHRKNMILNSGQVVFLDWELALWGDPVYDLAVHFHKMAYHEDERQAVLDGWAASMPSASTRGWEKDLDTYLAHERVKSAVVDTVRYTQMISSGSLGPDAARHLLRKLTLKLNAAREVWRHSELITMAQVETVIRHQGAPKVTPPTR